MNRYDNLMEEYNNGLLNVEKDLHNMLLDIENEKNNNLKDINYAKDRAKFYSDRKKKVDEFLKKSKIVKVDTLIEYSSIIVTVCFFLMFCMISLAPVSTIESGLLVLGNYLTIIPTIFFGTISAVNYNYVKKSNKDLAEYRKENFFNFSDRTLKNLTVDDQLFVNFYNGRVKELTEKCIKQLIDYGCKTIVVACNTATSCAIGYSTRQL